MTPKKSRLLFILSVLLGVMIYLKNGWISDDAYIIFRSIEQLFAGNGPNWNPHERVQTFTSPLWFWLLAFTRIFSSNLYLNTMVISLFLWVGTLWILRKIFNNDFLLCCSILLFSASRGFYDYTSSGLENVLAYFFIALYLYLNYNMVQKDAEITASNKKSMIMTLFVYGLIICIRHDLALLLFPITVYSIWRSRRVFSLKQWASMIIVALFPFILWSLFCLYYYGFPFPNTAYAKINTGIDKILIVKQGMKYLASSFIFDTVTCVIIGTAVIICMKHGKHQRLRFLGYGLVLNLIYIIYVGGDFMQGRFLSYTFLISSIIVLRQIAAVRRNIYKIAACGALLLYLFLYPHTPFSTPLDYQNYSSKLMVSDERGTYFKRTSLYAYFIRYHDSIIFPPHQWSYQGAKFKMRNDRVHVFGNVGFFGYWAGTEKIIIDPLALADPLLSRLPVQGEWRVGHYLRDIPKGYLKSVETDKNLIKDPALNQLYDKIKIITQNDTLLSWHRIKTIMSFNLGAYNKIKKY